MSGDRTGIVRSMRGIATVLIVLMNVSFIAWAFINDLAIEYLLAWIFLGSLMASLALGFILHSRRWKRVEEYADWDEVDELHSTRDWLLGFAIFYLFVGVVTLGVWYASISNGSLAHPISHVKLKATPYLGNITIAKLANMTKGNSTKDPPTILQIGEGGEAEEATTEEEPSYVSEEEEEETTYASTRYISEEEEEEIHYWSRIYLPIYWSILYASEEGENITVPIANINGTCFIVVPPAFYLVTVRIDLNLPTVADIKIYNITFSNPFKEPHCVLMNANYGIKHLPATAKVDSVSPVVILFTPPINLNFICDIPPINATLVTNYGNYTATISLNQPSGSS